MSTERADILSMTTTMLTGWAEVELETAPAAAATAAAAKELGKWMATAKATTRESPLERIAALSSHRVIRIVAIVESLAQLGVGQDFVRFVNRRHLGF